jgi:hypothetical protein
MSSIMDWRTAPLMPQGVEHRWGILSGFPLSSDAVRRSTPLQRLLSSSYLYISYNTID